MGNATILSGVWYGNRLRSFSSCAEGNRDIMGASLCNLSLGSTHNKLMTHGSSNGFMLHCGLHHTEYGVLTCSRKRVDFDYYYHLLLSTVDNLSVLGCVLLLVDLLFTSTNNNRLPSASLKWDASAN